MSNWKIASLLLACAVGVCSGDLASAADEVEVLRAGDVKQPARTSLNSFEWLVGQWQGEGLGGKIEEVWVAAVDDAMQGMFRLVKDDQVVVYELMTLIDQNGVVTLQVRHFGPDFKAWEDAEKSEDFHLLRFDTGHFQFDGLTWTHDANQLVMHLVMKDKDGKERIERLELERRSRLVRLQ